MAGPTIASAEVDVDLDGSGMPAQAKRIAKSAGESLGKELVPYGKKAGEDTGDAFSEGFGKQTDSQMQEVARKAARSVEMGFRVDSDGIAKRFATQLEDSTEQGMHTVGEKAGTAFGRGFQVDAQGIAHNIADSTGKELVPRFRDAGGQSSHAYATGWAGGMDLELIRRPVLELTSKIVSDVRIGGGNAGTGFGEELGAKAKVSLRKQAKDLVNDIKKADWPGAGKGAGGAFSGGFNQGLFSGMDRTVALVIKLIASIGPQMAALGSALSANVVAILSSSLLGLAGAMAALVPVGIAAGAALLLTISAMDDMRAKVPGLEKAIDGVSAAWERQADALGTQVGPALRDFLKTLSAAMDVSGFGAAIGSSVALITQAFTDVLKSPGFAGFVNEMTEVIPSALTGFGVGIANLLEALLTFFSRVGPLAANLGTDFAHWAGGIRDAANTAASSGALQKFFDDAYNSFHLLMGVLGPFSKALGNVFLAGQDSGDRILTTLGDLAQKFLDWTNTVGGQNALATWFSQSEGIFNSLLGVLGTVGTTLAKLVTPATLESVNNFLVTLQDIIPILGEVLAAIGSADVLNLFATAILGILQALQPALPLLASMAEIIGNLPEGVITALAASFLVLAVALKALTSLAGVISTISTLVSVAQKLSLVPRILGLVRAAWLALSVAFTASPIGLIITAVVALVAALVWFFTQTETGKKMWAAAWAGIQDAAETVSTWFSGTLLPFFTGMWASLMAGAQAMGDFFGRVWQGILDLPKNVVAWFSGTFIPFFQALPGMLIDFMIAYVQFWISLPGRIIGALATLIAFLIQWGADAAVALIGWVTEAIPKMITFFAELPGNIIAAVDAFGAMLLGWITDAWNAMYDFVVNAFVAYITFWLELPGKVVAAVQSLLPLLGAFFGTLWTNITTSVSTGIENTVRFFRELPGKIMTALASLLGTIGRIFTDAMGEGNRAALDGIGKLLETVGRIPGQILTAVGDLSRTLYNAGRNIVQGLVDGVGSMAGAVGRKVNEIIGGLSAGVKKLLGIASPSKVFAEIGKNVMLGLGQGITVNAGNPIGAMNDVAGGLLGTRFGANAPGFAGNTRTTSTGRTLSVAPGAIVVNVPTENPEQAANAVLDRLVARWK